MKKILLLIIVVLTCMFSVTCFGAQSPSQKPIPTKEAQDNDNGKQGRDNIDKSDTSPNTGYMLGSMLFIMTLASGTVVLAKRKYKEP